MAIFTIASLLALAASSLATLPTQASIQKRNSLAAVETPTPADVERAINDWNSDVNAVNDFLNTVHDNLNDLSSLASNAQNVLDNFASDEGSQLNTLNNWFVNSTSEDQGDAPAAFNCAFNDLFNGVTEGNTLFSFGSLVIQVFKNIVADAGAGLSGAVSEQADVVSSYRCCNVLPDLDILWRDAAQSAGFDANGPVPFTPSRPDACATITCSSVEAHSTCGTLDNSRFGTPGS